MSNLSRRSFLKGALATAATAAVGSMVPAVLAEETAAVIYMAGSYSSVQSTDFATIRVTCDFSESALTSVAYELIETSDSDFFPAQAEALSEYCSRILEAGGVNGVDGVSGATLVPLPFKTACRTALPRLWAWPPQPQLPPPIQPLPPR